MAPSPAASGNIIIVKKSGEDGSKYPVVTGSITIGRGSECNIKILLKDVSIVQCTIATYKTFATITNLSDEFPTVVNNESIDSKVLKHGDIITLSNRNFRWEYMRPNAVKSRIPLKTTGSKKKNMASFPASILNKKKLANIAGRRSEILSRKVDAQIKRLVESRGRLSLGDLPNNILKGKGHQSVTMMSTSLIGNSLEPKVRKIAVVKPQRRSAEVDSPNLAGISTSGVEDDAPQLSAQITADRRTSVSKPRLVIRPHRGKSLTPPRIVPKRMKHTSLPSVASKGRRSTVKAAARGVRRRAASLKKQPVIVGAVDIKRLENVEKVVEPTTIDEHKKAALMLLTGRSPIKKPVSPPGKSVKQTAVNAKSPHKQVLKSQVKVGRPMSTSNSTNIWSSRSAQKSVTKFPVQIKSATRSIIDTPRPIAVPSPTSITRSRAKQANTTVRSTSKATKSTPGLAKNTPIPNSSMKRDTFSASKQGIKKSPKRGLFQTPSSSKTPSAPKTQKMPSSAAKKLVGAANKVSNAGIETPVGANSTSVLVVETTTTKKLKSTLKSPQSKGKLERIRFDLSNLEEDDSERLRLARSSRGLHGSKATKSDILESPSAKSHPRAVGSSGNTRSSIDSPLKILRGRRSAHSTPHPKVGRVVYNRKRGADISLPLFNLSDSEYELESLSDIEPIKMVAATRKSNTSPWANRSSNSSLYDTARSSRNTSSAKSPVILAADELNIQKSTSNRHSRTSVTPLSTETKLSEEQIIFSKRKSAFNISDKFTKTPRISASSAKAEKNAIVSRPSLSAKSVRLSRSSGQNSPIPTKIRSGRVSKTPRLAKVIDVSQSVLDHSGINFLESSNTQMPIQKRVSSQKTTKKSVKTSKLSLGNLFDNILRTPLPSDSGLRSSKTLKSPTSTSSPSKGIRLSRKVLKSSNMSIASVSSPNDNVETPLKSSRKRNSKTPIPSTSTVNVSRSQTKFKGQKKSESPKSQSSTNISFNSMSSVNDSLEMHAQSVSKKSSRSYGLESSNISTLNKSITSPSRGGGKISYRSPKHRSLANVSFESVADVIDSTGASFQSSLKTAPGTPGSPLLSKSSRSTPKSKGSQSLSNVSMESPFATNVSIEKSFESPSKRASMSRPSANILSLRKSVGSPLTGVRNSSKNLRSQSLIKISDHSPTEAYNQSITSSQFRGSPKSRLQPTVNLTSGSISTPDENNRRTSPQSAKRTPGSKVATSRTSRLSYNVSYGSSPRAGEDSRSPNVRNSKITQRTQSDSGTAFKSLMSPSSDRSSPRTSNRQNSSKLTLTILHSRTPTNEASSHADDAQNLTFKNTVSFESSNRKSSTSKSNLNLKDVTVSPKLNRSSRASKGLSLTLEAQPSDQGGKLRAPSSGQYRRNRTSLMYGSNTSLHSSPHASRTGDEGDGSVATPSISALFVLKSSTPKPNKRNSARDTIRHFELLTTPDGPSLPKKSPRKTIGAVENRVRNRKSEIGRLAVAQSERKPRRGIQKEFALRRTKGSINLQSIKSAVKASRRSNQSSDLSSNVSNVTDVNASKPDNTFIVTPKSTLKLLPELVKEKHSTAKKNRVSRKSFINHINESQDIVKQLFSVPVRRKLSQSIGQFDTSDLIDDNDLNSSINSINRSMQNTSRLAEALNVSFEVDSGRKSGASLKAPLRPPVAAGASKAVRRSAVNISPVKQSAMRKLSKNDLSNVLGADSLLKTPVAKRTSRKISEIGSGKTKEVSGSLLKSTPKAILDKIVDVENDDVRYSLPPSAQIQISNLDNSLSGLIEEDIRYMLPSSFKESVIDNDCEVKYAFASPVKTPKGPSGHSSPSPKTPGRKRKAPTKLMQSPLNYLSNLSGVRQLMKTPGRPAKSPHNDLTNVSGVKQLLKSVGDPQRSPKNDLMNVSGLKKLFKTRRSPFDDLTDVRGVKRLLSPPKSPRNNLLDVRGVKKLLGTPRRAAKSPQNDLTNVSGVGKLLKTPRGRPKTPKNDLSDVRGLKELFRLSKSPVDNLTNVDGVNQLFKSPSKPRKSPANNLSDLRGVKNLPETSGRGKKSPRNNLSNSSGIKHTLKSPNSSRVSLAVSASKIADKSPSKVVSDADVLFNSLLDRPPVRTYERKYDNISKNLTGSSLSRSKETFDNSSYLNSSTLQIGSKRKSDGSGSSQTKKQKILPSPRSIPTSPSKESNLSSKQKAKGELRKLFIDMQLDMSLSNRPRVTRDQSKNASNVTAKTKTPVKLQMSGSMQLANNIIGENDRSLPFKKRILARTNNVLGHSTPLNNETSLDKNRLEGSTVLSPIAFHPGVLEPSISIVKSVRKRGRAPKETRKDEAVAVHKSPKITRKKLAEQQESVSTLANPSSSQTKKIKLQESPKPTAKRRRRGELNIFPVLDSPPRSKNTKGHGAQSGGLPIKATGRRSKMEEATLSPKKVTFAKEILVADVNLEVLQSADNKPRGRGGNRRRRKEENSDKLIIGGRKTRSAPLVKDSPKRNSEVAAVGFGSKRRTRRGSPELVVKPVSKIVKSPSPKKLQLKERAQKVAAILIQHKPSPLRGKIKGKVNTSSPKAPSPKLATRRRLRGAINSQIDNSSVPEVVVKKSNVKVKAVKTNTKQEDPVKSPLRSTAKVISPIKQTTRSRKKLYISSPIKNTSGGKNKIVSPKLTLGINVSATKSKEKIEPALLAKVSKQLRSKSKITVSPKLSSAAKSTSRSRTTTIKPPTPKSVEKPSSARRGRPKVGVPASPRSPLKATLKRKQIVASPEVDSPKETAGKSKSGRGRRGQIQEQLSKAEAQLTTRSKRTKEVNDVVAAKKSKTEVDKPKTEKNVTKRKPASKQTKGVTKPQTKQKAQAKETPKKKTEATRSLRRRK